MGSSQEPVAFNVEVNTLKKVRQISYAVATALKDFDFVVETFDKATVFSGKKVVQNFCPPIRECVNKIIKAIQAALDNGLEPITDVCFGGLKREVRIENIGQTSLQVIGSF